MRKFFEYTPICNIQTSIDEILENECCGFVSFSKKGQSHDFQLMISPHPTRMLQAKLKANSSFLNNTVIFEADSAFSAFLSFRHNFQKYPFSLGTTISNSTTNKCSSPKDCIFTLSTNYYPKSINLKASVGIMKDKAIVTSLSSQTLASYVKVNSIVTSKMNLLETQLVLPKLNTFASIKGDMYAKKLNHIKFGYFRDLKPTNWFAIIELKKRTISFGMSSFRTGKTKIAISSKYKSKMKKFDFDIGFKVDRKCAFYGKCQTDGRLKFKTTIDPTEWLTITMSSETSAKDKFNPVLFGWGLDFHQNK